MLGDPRIFCWGACASQGAVLQGGCPAPLPTTPHSTYSPNASRYPALCVMEEHEWAPPTVSCPKALRLLGKLIISLTQLGTIHSSARTWSFVASWAGVSAQNSLSQVSCLRWLGSLCQDLGLRTELPVWSAHLYVAATAMSATAAVPTDLELCELPGQPWYSPAPPATPQPPSSESYYAQLE